MSCCYSGKFWRDRGEEAGEGRKEDGGGVGKLPRSSPPPSLCFPESIFRFPFSFRSIAEEEEEDAKSFSLLLAFPRIVSKKNAAATR